jgi:cobalt-precorrin 5A hydrolase
MAPCDAGDAMDMDKAMIVAGIGCRKGVSATQIQAAIAAAFVGEIIGGRLPGLLAAPAVKKDESSIRDAADTLGLGLIWISQDALEAAGPRTQTHSARSMAAMNVPSVAEACALAGAGPNGRLLRKTLIVGSVTCALAESSP